MQDQHLIEPNLNSPTLEFTYLIYEINSLAHKTRTGQWRTLVVYNRRMNKNNKNKWKKIKTYIKLVKSLKSTVAFSVAQHLICQKANLVVLFQRLQPVHLQCFQKFWRLFIVLVLRSNNGKLNHAKSRNLSMKYVPYKSMYYICYVA